MGYCNTEGEDKLEELQTSGRCMARALCFLLKENEGIVVDLPFQIDYPLDPCGKYIIYRQHKMINVLKILEKDPRYNILKDGEILQKNEEMVH